MQQPVQPNHRTRSIRVLCCAHAFEPTSAGEPRTCGSPALRGESFCYYHHPTRKVSPNRRAYLTRCRDRRIARQTFTVPLPTTRRELLGALNQIIALLAANQIDPRRASLLFTALATIGRNLNE
jgi:hypothetical protein